MTFWNKVGEYDYALWEIKVWIDTDKWLNYRSLMTVLRMIQVST